MAREIRIYTTPTCPHCTIATRFLDDNGVKYQEFNIVEDRAAQEEMNDKCKSLAVPTICFDNEVVVGFNEADLRKKLGLSR